MIEAMTLWLEALKSMKETLAEHDEPTTFNEDEAIKSLEEALKQEQGEPVAWKFYLDGCNQVVLDEDSDADIRFNGVPLYTTPQQRTWVGLTNQERSECWETIPQLAMKKVEAKLKELNT